MAATSHIHIALIRGINVGTAKRVAMADLRTLVATLSYRDVRTVLNSGNVVFSGGTPADPAARIEKALASELGVRARVLVLTARELAAIVAGNSLEGIADNPSRLLVAVLANAADGARLEPLLADDWSPEAFALGPRAAYLWCPAGVIKSRLSATVGRTLADRVTMRNWATITKLHALASG